MPYRPSQFQLTVIKPYYKDNSSKPVQDALEDALKDAQEDAQKKNYDKRAPEGNYDSDTIVVDIPQL